MIRRSILQFLLVATLALAGCDSWEVSYDSPDADNGNSNSGENTPEITVNDNSVVEGDSGRKALEFTVRLSASASQTVSVDYTLNAVEATEDTDYAHTSGQLQMRSGETSKAIEVEIIGDTEVESGETFELVLSNPVNASLKDSKATGTIIDDDSSSNPPTPTLKIDDRAVNEGDSGQTNLVFTVEVDPPATEVVTVDYRTQNATAASGDDFDAVDGTLSIPAGESSATIEVAVSGDTVEEGSEYFTLILSNPENATLPSDPTAKGTIVGDDQAAPPPLDPGDDATTAEAARFLTQATFGPTQSDINALLAMDNLEEWVDKQFNEPMSPRHYPYVDTYGGDSKKDFRHDIWWKNAIQGKDQLRQRVAFALSQIFVVSDVDYTLKNSQRGMADYYDMLVEGAFGNYRDLLEKVTLHPVMGIYLSMVQNEKADEVRNIRPDENYAREVLQLFSLGLYELNQDGTPKIGVDGRPLPTYRQADIEEFAKVFTGWNFKGASWGQEAIESDTNRVDPMEPWQEYHDMGEKYLLNSATLPAGQSAEIDLKQGLDNIFNHPNVGPFISRMLIQRLVTSNPTPGYVARVAAHFNNNGQGVRGDLKAVVKAILLDEEAREGHLTMPTTFGKLREPLLRFTHLWRAFDAIPRDGVNDEQFYVKGISGFEDELGQGPLRSPSVFNFYLPEYIPPGVLQDSDLFGPEFQIATEGNLVNTNNIIHTLIYSLNNVNKSLNSGTAGTFLDLEAEEAMATNLDTLLDHLNILLMSGSMSSEFKQSLKAHLSTISAGNETAIKQVEDAIFMIVTSPQYLIQQ
ncbi:MAG: DUF1800 family protein [Gammaproteobacteria bacterium]|nr:DUF1800 family protein [Gammaproteobacteria bacterium]